jgi:lysophospholipase L1-like esterase
MPTKISFSRVSCKVALLLSSLLIVQTAAADWQKTDTSIAWREGTNVVWQFNFDPSKGKPYFHPVTVNSGPSLTNFKPEDHPWHYGLWFSWKYIDHPDSTNHVNYWEEDRATGHAEGKTRWSEPTVCANSDGSAKIYLDLTYVNPSNHLDLTEHREIDVSAPATDGSYAIDWHGHFVVGDEPVILDRTPMPGESGGQVNGGYAGLAFRMAGFPLDVSMLSAAGPIVDFATNRARPNAPAVGFNFTQDGKPAGSLAIFSDKANAGENAPWYLVNEPKRPFRFACAAILAPKPINLPAGAAMDLNYHIAVQLHPWTPESLQAAQNEQAGQYIAASDPRFRYEGRFDMSDPAKPQVIWEASRISLDFDGPTLKLLFGNAQGDCFFDATIDGKTKMVELPGNRPPANAEFFNLEPGRHHLTLFKRSEASAGTATFEGVDLADGAKARATPDPGHKTTMAFFGDSISVGACDEDGPADQWIDRSTHNAAKSYNALTAAAFDADFENISVSGMGIATGFFPIQASNIWDHIRPDPNSPKADLTKWTPKIVFVHLGENDGGYPKAKGLPFPTNYTSGYIDLVHSMRATFPNAEIVLIQGGMWNGANSPDLLNAWHAAVKTLESSDSKIADFQFKHWVYTHPRVIDHRAMADELIAWLKQQDFMKQ